MKRRNHGGAFFSNNRVAALKVGVMLTTAAMAGMMGAGRAHAQEAAVGTGLGGDGLWSDASNWTTQRATPPVTTTTPPAPSAFPTSLAAQ